MSLKAHALHEALRDKHVITLHRYNELFRDHVAHDAHTMLGAAWTNVLKKLKLKLTAEEQAELLLAHPKALTDVRVHSSGKTVYGSRISLAVKAPLMLGAERLNILKRELFESTLGVYRQLISKWPEAFCHERSTGQLTTDFTLKHDDKSVRLCLCSTKNGVEHETTLLRVIHEEGKPNSKLRNYEQVYFTAV